MTFNLKPQYDRTPDMELYPVSLEILPEGIRAQYIRHDSGSHNDCYDFEYRQFSPWPSVRVIMLHDNVLLMESIPDFRKTELGTDKYTDQHWPWYKTPQWMWHKLELPIPAKLCQAVLGELRKYHPVLTDPAQYTPAERPKVNLDNYPV